MFVIPIICILVIAIYAVVLIVIAKIPIFKIKALADDKDLNEISKKLPDDITMCREYLNMLKNGKTKVVKNESKSSNSAYSYISDTIFIANFNNSYARIQTIAHECIHSMQNKGLHLINFILSNILPLYVILLVILKIFDNAHNREAYILVLIVLSLSFCLVRWILERDAIKRSEELSKKYLESKEINIEEKERLIEKITRNTKIVYRTYPLTIITIPLIIVAIFSTFL